MFGWIYSHLLTFLTYLIAPIIFHTNCDSYVLLFLFTILELSDTFTGYRIYILFMFSGLLMRNYLFTWFKSSILLKKNTSDQTLTTNNLKNLILLPTSLVRTLVSQTTRLFKFFVSK